jgi:hypothetical protein
MTKSKIQMTNQCQSSNVKEKTSFGIESFGFDLAFGLCHLSLYLFNIFCGQQPIPLSFSNLDSCFLFLDSFTPALPPAAPLRTLWHQTAADRQFPRRRRPNGRVTPVSGGLQVQYHPGLFHPVWSVPIPSHRYQG